MGCFNVACSISNLSIGAGTEVAFFPLWPNKYTKEHLVEPTSNLIYPYCYYNPLTLPIFGQYDDYGSVENIVEDDNTKAIEKFFNISIKEFIECVTCNRDITDQFGEVFNTYTMHKEFLSDFGTQFNEKWLLTLGFDKKEGFYTFQDFPFEVYIEEKEQEKDYIEKGTYFSYKIVKEGTTLKELSDHPFSANYEAAKNFQKDFVDVCGYYLGVDPENQRRVGMLQDVSGMFVHKEIYDELIKDKSVMGSSYVTSGCLKDWGFREIPSEEQFMEDPHHEGLWRKEGYNFDVKLGNYGSVIIPTEAQEYYVYDESDLEKLKRDWEKITGENPPEILDATYNLKKDKDKQWKEICKNFKKLTGASLGWASGNFEQERAYNIISFRDKWEKLTNEKLDELPIEKEAVFGVEYEKCKENLISQIKREKELSELEEKLAKLKENKELTEDELILLDHLKFVSKYSSLSVSDFGRFFEKWEIFSELYKEAIGEGKLKAQFIDYQSFYWDMYSMNRFFFPAMNGEQHGNLDASCKLLLKSLEIVKREMEEQEEYS